MHRMPLGRVVALSCVEAMFLCMYRSSQKSASTHDVGSYPSHIVFRLADAQLAFRTILKTFLSRSVIVSDQTVRLVPRAVHASGFFIKLIIFLLGRNS